jgi:hypothetical protein
MPILRTIAVHLYVPSFLIPEVIKMVESGSGRNKCGPKCAPEIYQINQCHSCRNYAHLKSFSFPTRQPRFCTSRCTSTQCIWFWHMCCLVEFWTTEPPNSSTQYVHWRSIVCHACQHVTSCQWHNMITNISNQLSQSINTLAGLWKQNQWIRTCARLKGNQTKAYLGYCVTPSNYGLTPGWGVENNTKELFIPRWHDGVAYTLYSVVCSV